MSCDTVKQNLCVYEGDDKTLSFTSDMGDLTGYQIHFQARVEKSSRYAIIDEIGTVTDTSGGYSISFSSADTLGKYREDPYFYDIKLTSPDGKIHTDRYGMFTIEERTTDITQTVITHKYGVDVSKDGTEVKKEANNINFVGSSVSVSENGEGVNVEVKAPAAAPTLALHFAGIYDDLQSLQDAIPSPSENMQAIVIQPSEKYYHGVGGAWVELAPVGAFHSKYLGVYDTVQDLQAANPSPVTDSLAIVGTSAKTFYLYDGSKWDQLRHTDLPSLDARVTDEEKKTSDNVKRLEVAEQHLQTLQTKTSQHDSDISGLGDDVRQLQGQVYTGNTIKDDNGNSLNDITGLKFIGAEVSDDDGDQEATVTVSPKITVANGQEPSSTSATGNALIFPQATITPDPGDSNVLTVIPYHEDSGIKGISVGDGANASREVQTILFNGHQAFGSDNTAEIHLEFAHFKTLGERNTWTSKFSDHMDFDLVAVVDADENGYVGWYRFDSATKAWKDYPAQGVIVGDSSGFVPKNIKTIVLGTGLTAQQAGDQEDAVLINVTGGGDADGMTINSQHISDLETEWPLQIDNIQSQDRLLIDPSAYESQHANACLLELDHSVHTKSGSETELYLSHEIVPTGEYFSLNPAARGVNVQDNSGGDTSVTGGQLTRIMAAVSFYGKAVANGNVKIWIYYKDPASQLAGGILTGVGGNPMVVERYYNAGDDMSLEPLIIANAMMATGQAPIVLKIESTLEVEVNPTKTLLCIEQFANGYQTSIASIEFQRRMGLELHAEIKTFSEKEVELKEELAGMNEPLGNIPPNSGGDFLNDFGVQNNTKLMASVVNGVFNISANGEPADYYVDAVIDNVQTQMLRGHEIMYSANFKNRDNAFRVESYAWTGKPDEMPKVWNTWGNTEPTLNSGFTLIKSKYQSEQVDGLFYDVEDQATIPANANNIVILIRPVVKSDPSDLSVKDFWWGAPHKVNGYVEVGRYKVDEMHFKFDKGYGEFYLDNQGYQSVRYTINNTQEGNPLPVGIFMKGKAPIERDGTVNTVPGSQVPQFDGAIKFNKDGEARVSHTYWLWNDQITDDTVTFWDVLIDADGNVTKIPQSEKTFTAKGNQGASGVFVSIPAYSVEVLTGQRIGARASSNIKDGAYIKSDAGGKFATQTVIEFDELIADSSDSPDLVSVALPKSLVVDRRYYEFNGNTAQNITISDFVIPSDVTLASVTADRKTANGYSSIDEIQHSYNATTQIMTIHVGGVSDGIVFFDFWSK